MFFGCWLISSLAVFKIESTVATPLRPIPTSVPPRLTIAESTADPEVPKVVKSISLEALANSIGAQLKLGGAHPGKNVEQSKREIITGIAPLGAAKPGESSHLS